MELTRVNVENYSRLRDLDIAVRGHLVIVGANDVGKTSLLRLLNLLLGSTTAQLYQGLAPQDLRDSGQPLIVTANFASFTDEERILFHREIEIDPENKSESMPVRLEVALDPDDSESVVISRWCPGRGEVRALTREQLSKIGWRFLPASRSTAASQLDGPNSAVQILLRAVESELGDEKTKLTTLLGSFNKELEKSGPLSKLRKGVATHLSNSMPKEVTPDKLSIRTSSDRTDSVLENVSMYIAKDDSFIPLAEQSDGIRQLISMTLFDLAEGAANVIAVDEPELHLHPLSQRTVADLLTKEVNQKILVTHSPYVVQRFDPTQVVAVSPDGACHQIDPERFSVAEKAQAHWWSPRMLEALTARFVIVVEGVADRLIVEAAAKALGISLDRAGAIVFELGGAENFPTVYKLLGPAGFGVEVLGLVDEAESPKWIGAIGGKPRNVIDTHVFISRADLEEEYCRTLGAAHVAKVLVAAGVAKENAILASCDTDNLDTVDAARLASFCRASSKLANRKVPSALAISKSLDETSANNITSIATLLNQLKERAKN